MKVHEGIYMSDKKDFFISYNTKDEQWAMWIAGVLEDNGYSTIIQAWDFKPGNNFVLKMQEAVDECKKTLLVLSQNYVDSLFCQPEWASAFRRDPTGTERNVIPVRIDNISPPGLLAQIVYIDLYKRSEYSAKAALLNGIKETGFSRETPMFPGEIVEPASAATENSIYSFDFVINQNNISEAFSAKSKNSLREWFINGCKEDFTVTIKDQRIDIIQGHLSEIIQKIQQEQDLTSAEENTYDTYMRAIKKCEQETALKEKACTFFLKDSMLQGYLFITSPLKLYSFIERILNFDYFNEPHKKRNDPLYAILDFSISPPPKECHDYFTVPLERERIKEVFGDVTNYHIGGYAVDLGGQLLEEVAVYYYLFLAEEILKFNMNKITENKKVMNLLNYQVGLH